MILFTLAFMFSMSRFLSREIVSRCFSCCVVGFQLFGFTQMFRAIVSFCLFIKSWSMSGCSPSLLALSGLILTI